MAVTFGFGVLLAPLIIPILLRLRSPQSLWEEGPKAHQKKAGTPTMGGVIFLSAVVLASVPLASRVDTGNAGIFFLLFATLSYGIVGFMDDYIKVVMRRNLGLTARQKLLGQVFIGMKPVSGCCGKSGWCVEPLMQFPRSKYLGQISMSLPTGFIFLFWY